MMEEIDQGIQPAQIILPPISPLIDELTRKMTSAWRHAEVASFINRNRGICGRRKCKCGISEGSEDPFRWVTSGEKKFFTHSFCIHYLAYHRSDLHLEELEIIRSLCSEEEPTEQELWSPPRQVGFRILLYESPRQSVEATGSIGVVYATEQGKELTNTELGDREGWLQVNGVSRVRVEAENMCVHGPALYVWYRHV